jgi:hypothetical protein
MASYTAQVLVGTADFWHGGIDPTHFLWLSENSRPAWVLEPADGNEGGLPVRTSQASSAHRRIVWVPSTVEHILGEGLLLIALHVERNEPTIELARTWLPALLDDST